MNPFVYESPFELEDDESLDDLIRDLKMVNRIARQHRSLLQWIAIPVGYTFSLLAKPVTIFLDQAKQRQLDELEEYIDWLEDGPFIHVERRRPENAGLRKIFNMVKTHVQYHMMPNTLKTKRVDAA